MISHNLSAKISVSVDRSSIVMKKPFNLIFESDTKINAQPDFEPLKKSITILNKSNKTKTQIVNGRDSYSQQWILEVLPISPGKLQIPAIRFGNEISQSRSINVEGSPSGINSKQNDDVFLEVEVNTAQPYIQAQVIYTVKLYRAMPTSYSSLKDPQISGGQVVINVFDNDKNYETVLNGKRYGVFERRYAIFPQTSGTLTIEPIVFQTLANSSSFKLLDSSGLKHDSIARQSKAIQLDVKPIPDSYTGNTWLPAEQLTIQEQWSVAPEILKQAEAVTRTLTLKANGLVASNLPQITETLPDRLKHYPDQSEFEETNNANGIIGIRHDKMDIIPMDGGDYILAAIRVPWWNTVTDKMEFAELPERTIHAKISDVVPVPIDEQALLEENKFNIIGASSNSNHPLWKWVSLILFILWVITLFLLWKKKPAVIDRYEDSSNYLSRRQHLNKLKQACADNNATMAKKALLDWEKVNWPNEKVLSIDTIKNYSNDDLSNKIDELNNYLYGKEKNQWNGAGFLNVFESQTFSEQTKTEVKGKLEPLYKT